tara:strand:- start:1381 stop:1554 length:174 start_codon:yes stop_codon:yes gene_type:complete
MPELTSEQKEQLLLQQIKNAREDLYAAENLGKADEVITELTSIVTTLETAYDNQFGE